MKTILITVFILSGIVFSAIAQPNIGIADVVILKDGGVVKGFIHEQIPGKEIKITPSETVLKIKSGNILDVYSNKIIDDGRILQETDVVVLKDNTQMEGKILEQAPGQWLLIRVDNPPASLSYRYDEIEKIGKETMNDGIDILKAYGVIDIIETKDETIRGIILEQWLGHSLKIKTLDHHIYVYDIGNIISSGKEACDASQNIIKQSVYLDVINLKDGTSIKGVIVKQMPNKDMQIETVENSSIVVKIPDIIKLSKVINPNKE